MKTAADADVIIVGAGLAGLACARRLMQNNTPFVLLEANHRVGGRVKTDNVDGFLLDRGFQVLQTAYPEAQRVLDFHRLELKPFAPGAMIRTEGNFYRIADPRRRPRDLFSTLTAPIGTFADRLRILKLAHHVRRKAVSNIFKTPDMPTVDFLREQGFSEQIVQRFFKPFFAGVCLDPAIKASSRVFRYIFRIFAQGDVALPSRGMGAIAEQLAADLPGEQIRTGTRVQTIGQGEVVLASGEKVKGGAIVLATEGPETARLLGAADSIGSQGELCLYFAAKQPPVDKPYLVLNGDSTGRVNSLTVPSIVAPTYAPDGQHLISVVVIGNPDTDDTGVETIVRRELTGWFGGVVGDWRHLKTYHIPHALPAQRPPLPDPTVAKTSFKPGIFVCGEYHSVPGIQWALLSGRHAAEQVLEEIRRY